MLGRGGSLSLYIRDSQGHFSKDLSKPCRHLEKKSPRKQTSTKLLSSHLNNMFQHQGGWCGGIRENMKGHTGDEGRQKQGQDPTRSQRLAKNLNSTSEQEGKTGEAFKQRSVSMFLLCSQMNVLLAREPYTWGRGRTRGKNKSKESIQKVLTAKKSEKKWWFGPVCPP